MNIKAAGIPLLLLELLALAYQVRAATRPGLSSAARRPWWLMSIALALLIAGGIGFSLVFANGIRTWSPEMVLALTGRLLVIPVLLGALLSFASEPMDRRARWKLGMDVTTVLGAGLMIMWYLVLGPSLSSGGLLAPLRLAAVLFSVGDVVLLVGVGTVLLRGAVGSARRPLSLLLAGTLCYLVIDILFLYKSAVVGGGLPDVVVPSLLLVPVFLMLLSAIEPPVSASAAAVADQPLRRHNNLPYLALVVGYGLLVAAAVKAGIYPWLGLVVGALLMTLGVAARQILASRENYLLVITDSLTGLANRIQLREALFAAVDRHRRTGTSTAVLLIDLDGFKQVNDTYGHEIGDQMLVSFAAILRRTVRGSDVPARLGGDEFAVVLPAISGVDDATQVAERILAECRRPLTLAGHTLQVSASIGVAVAESRPDGTADDCDPNELLHRADLAMYSAKRRQTHTWVLYSPDTMDAGFADELAQAVENGQLQLRYQPIVALVTGELVAVEAVIRWRHPTRGLLEPDVFMPLAEKTGLINRIDEWMLEQACVHVGQWRTRLPSGRSLYLHVNLSPSQLERAALAADVLRVLGRTGFDASGLVVGITKSALRNDRPAASQLEVLRGRGVRVALDDFRTGYSSLRYLTRLPVDILKLDRWFLTELHADPERTAVAEAIIRLSEILCREPLADGTAEGTGDLAQAGGLAAVDSGQAQVHHFAWPLPPHDIETLIHRSGTTWPRSLLQRIPQQSLASSDNAAADQPRPCATVSGTDASQART